MGSAFHQLCPRYRGTLTPAAPTAIKLWDTFTFTLKYGKKENRTNTGKNKQEEAGWQSHDTIHHNQPAYQI